MDIFIFPHFYDNVYLLFLLLLILLIISVFVFKFLMDMHVIQSNFYFQDLLNFKIKNIYLKVPQ